MAKRRGLNARLVGTVAAAVLVAAALAPSGTPADGKRDGRSFRGAGATMVENGTGSSSFKPIITKVAFHWLAGAGRFECLALAPSAEAGSPGAANSTPT
jgi:hypothetical protein